jgi:peptidoglycan/xylan/chitin deacetylase (PgdA/CDA1 family)
LTEGSAQGGMSPGGAARGLLKRLLSPLMTIRGPRGFVYLTFDDGPVPDYTPQILEVLEAHSVKATFFMVGALIERHPDLAAQVVAKGHTAGYHSFLHRHVRDLSIKDMVRDLETIRNVPGWTGAPMRHYRPPYGELSVVRLLWCLINRIGVAMWSLDSGDSAALTADQLVLRLSPESVRDGDVILFHDDSKVTVEALPRILQNLHEAGYSFAAL